MNAPSRQVCCGVCGKTFKSKRGMGGHAAIHGEQPRFDSVTDLCRALDERANAATGASTKPARWCA